MRCETSEDDNNSEHRSLKGLSYLVCAIVKSKLSIVLQAVDIQHRRTTLASQNAQQFFSHTQLHHFCHLYNSLQLERSPLNPVFLLTCLLTTMKQFAQLTRRRMMPPTKRISQKLESSRTLPSSTSLVELALMISGLRQLAEDIHSPGPNTTTLVRRMSGYWTTLP
jgi:hypothetical protein